VGLIDVAKDTLKDLPISEVLRERLSLALEQSAVFERQVGELQAEKGGLQAQLEREHADHEATKKKLKNLEETLREETRFVHDVEFKRGTRTGNEWKPFCPKCHLPLAVPNRADWPFTCSDGECGWASSSTRQVVHEGLAGLA